jgi:hypothetical protein
VIQNEINVVVIGEEPDPVRVRACIVAGFSINCEVEPVGGGEGS